MAIELHMYGVQFAFLDLEPTEGETKGGRKAVFRDAESGIVVHVPFTELSWEQFVAGAKGRDIIVPTLDSMRQGLATEGAGANV